MADNASDKIWTKDFILGTLISFLVMVNYYSLMVVITDYSMTLYNAPASAAGLAASIFIIGALFSRLLAGILADRFGKKRLLLFGAAAELVFSVLYLANIGFIPLFFLRFVHGFFYGTCSSTIGTVVTSLVPSDKKGEGVGYYMLATTLGAAIGPFMGMFISQHVSYEALFVAAAVVAALCLFSVTLLNTGEPKAAERKASAAASGKTAPKLGLRSFIEPSALGIGMANALLFFCYSSLLTFLTPFAGENGLETASSFFFVVYAAATFLTRPITGKMFDRKGDRSVMVPAFILFVIGMALLSTADNPVTLLVAAALLGIGVGTIQSSGLALAVRIAPVERIGLANSTFYLLTDLGVGVGPVLLGIVEPMWGYRGVFLSMAALAAFALVFYLFIGRSGSKMRRLMEQNG